MREGWKRIGEAYRKTYSESLFVDVEPGLLHRGNVFVAKGYIKLTEERWVSVLLGVYPSAMEAMEAGEEGLRRVKEVTEKVT